jgi:uncharacterized protein (TIGR03000 family)
MKNRMPLMSCLAGGCAALIACMALAQSGDPPRQASAQITVTVPASAEVFFDGTPTTQTGALRVYSTPPLSTGQTYYYTVRARWQEAGKTVEQTRKVVLSSNARVRLDFLEPTGAQPGGTGQAQRKKPDAEEAAKIGVEAYIYGYPLVTMEMTRRHMTNVVKPTEGVGAPMGQLVRMRKYPTAEFRQVTAPNADTLYVSGWIDVAKEPWVLSLPDAKARYYMFPMLNAWTDVFQVPGTRTTGDGAQVYAITGPGWKGTLPSGVKEYKSETALVWFIGRIYCTGSPEDYAAVHKLEDAISLVPLSSFGKAYTPPPGAIDPKIDMKKAPKDEVNALGAQAYFDLLAKLMNDNPPAKADAPMVVKMARIGIVAGQEFDISKLDPAIAKALQDVPKTGLETIKAHFKKAGKDINGWQLMTQTGLYGTDYLQRALVTYFGLGANRPQDAVYPTSEVDGDGKPYDGANKYVLHFAKGKTPPARGFWSVTMYDADYFFAKNSINRYTVSSRSDFKYNEDGSLDVYIQKDSPGKEKEANWLPAPSGKFVLMLRLYWPTEMPPSIIDGTWTPPAVKVAK